VATGGWVFVAGTTAVDEVGEVVGVGDAYSQARFILAKIGKALEQAGASLGDVVRTVMYVTDITQWEAVGRAHGEVFASIRPSATMVEVRRLLDPRMLVEI
jgi:enamine deaminase RidA (YjgF/YER057c/UK114 family)